MLFSAFLMIFRKDGMLRELKTPIDGLRDVVESSLVATSELERVSYALRIFDFEIAICLEEWTRAEDIVRVSFFIVVLHSWYL
jgi:hypothetical protein